MVVIDVNAFADMEEEEFVGVKGSIVRLYMENFVTYRRVEMRGGPHVNLILGLNGTGKSTIVCAICIGLAGKPTILGRAGTLKSFIRRGATSSKIEIELFNPDGQNFVIQRLMKLTDTGCSSDWVLNNKRVLLEKIEKLTKDLNIQLDNLCQFLPQDRVQEFAEMDNIKLLKSTEVVIGNDSLSSNHQKLIDYNASIMQMETTLQHTANTLRIEEQLNQGLETDVQTYHQREEIKKKMEELDQNIAWIKYVDALNIFNRAQCDLKDLTKKKKEKENSLAPLKKAIENLDAQLKKFREQMQKIRQKNFNKWDSLQRAADAEKESVASGVSEVNIHMKQAEKREEEKIKRHNTFLQKAASYEYDMNEFLSKGEHDEELLKQQIGDWENERAEIMREIINLTFLDDKDKAEWNVLDRKISTAEAELSRFDDLRVSRMKFLERNSPDVYKAVKYFELPENQAKLKGKIHEPMILHICVTDLAYGKIAERHLGNSDMTAFFCEDKDDVETVFELSNQLKVRLSVIHHNLPNRFERSRSNIPADVMRKFHFKKVLLDLLDGSDYYMSYICKRHAPEDVPIGGAQTDAMSKEIISSTGLRAFYTDSYQYNVQTSFYSGQKCTTTGFIRDLQPRIFTSEINATERTKLISTIAEMKEDHKKLSDSISSRSTRVKTRESDSENALRKIKANYDKLEFKNDLERKIKTAKDSAEKLGKELVDLTGMREESKQKCHDLRMQKLAGLERIANTVAELRSNGLSQNVMKRQLSVLQARFITKNNQYEDAKNQVDEDNNDIKALTLQVNATGDIAEKLKLEAQKKGKTDRPPQAVFDGLLDIAELERTYNSEKGRLGHLSEKDLGVVKQYEEKLKEIEALKKTKQGIENKVLALKTDMELTKEQWLGPLRELVQRINRNFAKFFQAMQCAGQVLLNEAEQENDFGKYGIKIMVSFRKGEPLSELCGWKQSGGERAISTALYVLSLQELTTVPFRVIDEINQGMDAKNEARFFNLLCSLASGHGTPQYFLLTPKMLPPVEYHDNVSFHFIFNGPHVKDMYPELPGSSDDEMNESRNSRRKPKQQRGRAGRAEERSFLSESDSD